MLMVAYGHIDYSTEVIGQRLHQIVIKRINTSTVCHHRYGITNMCNKNPGIEGTQFLVVGSPIFSASITFLV